jgi:hypothetical protein
MAKFHIKLKLQGLEIEVDGTREDAPVIQQALTQQFAGLLNPATVIVEGEMSTPPTNGNGVLPVAQPARRTRRKPSAVSSTGSGGGREAAVDWKHDTSKYGSPLQEWKTSDKALWILYVAAAEANAPEMTGKQIELSFNKHFRQAGAIRANNVIRDLGKLKASKNGVLPQVSQDTTKDPSTWYLTDAGRVSAQALVTQSRGQKA